MKAYRLVTQRYADSQPISAGARLFGGRWNPQGTEVIYATLEPDDAIREALPHMDASGFVGLVRIALDLGNVSYRGLLADELSLLTIPSDFSVTQAIGEQWLAQQDTCVLIVPSFQITGSHSVVINPQHREFENIRIDKFESIFLRSSREVDTRFSWYRYVDKRGYLGRSSIEPVPVVVESQPTFDVFISHAKEDKSDIAIPISDAMQAAGLRAWLDSKQISWGDSIDERISHGLTSSRFVLAVLTRTYVSKEWTMAEYRYHEVIEHANIH